MIDALLPSGAVAVELRGERQDARAHPAEVAALGPATYKRTREFRAGRSCARGARERLGLPASPVLRGERGEPLWPEGVVGSITHCAGYCACALSPSSLLAGLGIDAEPDAPLPAGVLEAVAGPGERVGLERLSRERPALNWGRLLFSAKESVYKACLGPGPASFEDATIVIDPEGGSFRADLQPGGRRPEGPPTVEGRWLAEDGLLLTAVALRPRALRKTT